MRKAVLISIRPEWTRLILSGEKTIEVRKTRPKLETPYKCYIYQTLPKSGDWNDRDGHVIGEFVCDSLTEYQPCVSFTPERVCFSLRVLGCLKAHELWKYSDGKPLYGWHISDLKIYDKPKELHEFMQCHKCEYYSGCKEHEYGCDGIYKVKRPPMSWYYVEELTI